MAAEEVVALTPPSGEFDTLSSDEISQEKYGQFYDQLDDTQQSAIGLDNQAQLDS